MSDRSVLRHPYDHPAVVYPVIGVGHPQPDHVAARRVERGGDHYAGRVVFGVAVEVPFPADDERVRIGRTRD